MNVNLDELTEVIAALEHDQWMHWSQAVASDVPAAIRKKWAPSWGAYSELSNEMKEADRVWARKVVELLRERKLIP